MFSTDRKYLRLVPPRGRKFGVIETHKILRFSPLYLRNASKDPQFFFSFAYRIEIVVRVQRHKNCWQADFVKFGIKKISKRGRFPQMGGGSPFVLTLLDTNWKCPLTSKKFWGGPPKMGENAPLNISNPQNFKKSIRTPKVFLTFFHQICVCFDR